MIVGNGLIAYSFQKYERDDDVIIFASGVSDSKNCSDDDFIRERELLKNHIHTYPGVKIIYFGTCATYDPDLVNTPYVQHKLKMENLITATAQNYLICRLPNIAGTSNNQTTILNFLHSHIRNNIPFDLRIQTERNILDIEDMYTVVDTIIQKEIFCNSVVNIANTMNYPVIDIVRFFENNFKTKALYTPIHKGGKVYIDTSAIQPIYDELGLTFDVQYLHNTLAKYFGEKQII